MKLEEIKKLMSNVEYKKMVYQTNRNLEILCDGVYKNYQFYILNLGTHPTAYIEIPKISKLFGKTYDELYEMGIDVDVHGGLTYSNSYLQNIKRDTWFIGWDYAHWNDYAGYEEYMPKDIRTNGKKWTTEEIFEDVVNAIEQIKEKENLYE